MAVLTGSGSALGFRFHTGLPSILAAYGLAYLFYLAVCWISVLIGLVAPSPETVQGTSFIWVMPLVFGSSVLLPDTRTMPGWLQAWVKINPVTDVSNAARGLMLNLSLGHSIVDSLLWTLGILVVFAPMASWAYRRQS